MIHTLNAITKFKVGSSNEWSANDLILADREVAYDSTTKRFKIGNGTSKFSELEWFDNIDEILQKVDAYKDEIPKNVSELQNDAGYINQEVVAQLVPIKTIKVNDVMIQPDENHAVNIETIRYKVGTADPNTTNCPNGYFYFQIGD